MREAATARVEVYQYPAGPEPLLSHWDGLAEPWPEVAGSDAGGPSEPAGQGNATAENLRAQSERQVVEEARQGFETGRQQGIQEGLRAEREAQGRAHAAGELHRVEQAAKLIQNFTEERDRYLQAVEHEVVALALAVAARILRREAQMDPLLLTGAVRVALGQLSNSTQVRLRVPPAELDLWTEAIAHMPNLALKPTVLAGDEMLIGDCLIEAELGSVNLGIRSQLAEIERGFFDRAGGARAERVAIETRSHERREQR